MTSSKTDEHGTPHFLAYAAREVLGEIYADIKACIVFHESVSVSEQISPPALDTDDSEDDAPKTPVKSCCCISKTQAHARLFEPDPEYDDVKYDRELTIKRYLRLIESPDYRIDLLIERFTEFTESSLPPEKEQRGLKPKSPIKKDLSLPSSLIVAGRKILPAVHKKILEALAIHYHNLPINQRIDIRTLFHEVKSFGYRYNYKSESWECV